MVSEQSSSEISHDGDHLHECNHCGERFWLGTHRIGCPPPCPDCGRGGMGYFEISPVTDPTHNTRSVEPEGDRDEMCARHWLLEGVRDGSCPDCLGADIPDGMGAVIATDGNGVTFEGETGDLPLLASAVLAPLSEVAATDDVHPGDVLATFPPGDLDSIEAQVGTPEHQSTLLEVA